MAYSMEFRRLVAAAYGASGSSIMELAIRRGTIPA